jgi:hypothetical protein
MVGLVWIDAMTYQIHRYPAELIDVIHLTDGERVVIRPVLPQDRELWSRSSTIFRLMPAAAGSCTP